MLAAANVQIFGQTLNTFAFTVDGAVGIEILHYQRSTEEVPIA
jgi:hypothetical protein